MRRVLVAALVLCPALLLPQVASARPTTVSDVACKVPTTFGRMFARLPAAHWPDAELSTLADEVMADQEADVTPEGEVDDEENGDIDAGYTYAGQLIDHDLTSDNRPNDLTTPVDPRTLPKAARRRSTSTRCTAPALRDRPSSTRPTGCTCCSARR